ncbi:phosphotransferase enzyme family protein [Gorillibacterium sp. sgz500922]|uniref:phosphotransferase enzyme family protein n=1 Tax=Gorillibacterium sp. sgz500922 TaxID=3446694 RepID=UPI003F66B082
MQETWNIASNALANYPLDRPAIDYIGQSGTTIFKVVDSEDRRYSLRLHLSKSETLDEAWTDAERIRSELDWLRALSRDTDLTVPTPVANHRGKFVTDVNGTVCTLVRWVEGETKPFLSTVQDVESLGETMGKLHRYASSWKAPDAFTRPSYDAARIERSLQRLGEQPYAGWLDPNTADLLERAGQRAIRMMNAMEQTPRTWGMIHADLIPGNFVFHGEEARLIDFGACGFGYYLFDLAWTFSYLHPAFREPLLAAYSNHFPLPDAYLERLEGLFVAAQLDTIGFWLGLPDAQEWLPAHIGKLTAREFGSYVRNEPFLFAGKPYWE